MREHVYSRRQMDVLLGFGGHAGQRSLLGVLFQGNGRSTPFPARFSEAEQRIAARSFIIQLEVSRRSSADRSDKGTGAGDQPGGAGRTGLQWKEAALGQAGCPA